MNNTTEQLQDIFQPFQHADEQAVPARLLDVFWTHPVALPPQASLEIVETPKLLTVPGAKCYLQGLMHWQNRHIPVLNLKSLLTGTHQTVQSSYCLVVLYRYPQTQIIEYGAILLEDIARTVWVKDSDFTELPEAGKLWPLIADSCFAFNNQHIPILNTQSLFCYGYAWDE